MSDRQPEWDGGGSDTGLDGAPGGQQGARRAERYCAYCGDPVEGQGRTCQSCAPPAGSRESASRPSEPTGRYVSALAGVAVMLFVGFVPVVGHGLGGFVAGYLRGSDNRESTITGGIAGALFVLPTVLAAGLIAVLGVFRQTILGNAGDALGVAVLVAVALFVFVFGTAAVGAVGGFLGATATDRPAP